MDLKKHIIDTIKEWQLKIGYREGNMKLYYPGDSLMTLLGLTPNMNEDASADNIAKMQSALTLFCEDMEPLIGRIKISGNYERYCLDIPSKGCAYVAGKVPEPEFLKTFLEVLTGSGSTIEKIRECFASYAEAKQTTYVEEKMTDGHADEHNGHAFYFADAAVEEYVYLVEENEFGLTYHRFTKEEYLNMLFEEKEKENLV